MYVCVYQEGDGVRLCGVPDGGRTDKAWRLRPRLARQGTQFRCFTGTKYKYGGERLV